MGNPSFMAPSPPNPPMEYPITFAREDAASLHDELSRTVTIFSALYWLLPVYQLANWIPKDIPTPSQAEPQGELEWAHHLLPHFEPFYTVERKVIPNGALLHHVCAFRFPTPRGPRSLSRALVETPARYFSPLAPTHGGGHFLLCYEDRERLGRFTYIQLDQLRFAWVAVRELLEEHKALHRHNGALTGLARRDIKHNNPIAHEKTEALPAAQTAPTPVLLHRPHPSSQVRCGPTPEARRARAALHEMRFMRDLLLEECAARWPHTPPDKAALFTLEEQVAEVVGGRKGKKGPRTFLASVELPLFHGKGGAARFRGTQWCMNKKDAENAAAEVALRALRGWKA